MIGLAIVGTGGMADGHARQFSGMRGVKVIACCDIDEGRAKHFAATHGIKRVTTDLAELLADNEISAISCVASDRAHAPVSISALRAGKHVLCEKPMATSLAEARNMVKAARAAGRVNMINFSYRDSFALQKAHQLVAAGMLGRITHVEASYLQSWLCSEFWGDWRKSQALLWRLSKDHCGGTLADIGCHIIDFATYVAGPVSRLSCQLSTLKKGEPGEREGDYRLNADDNVVIAACFEGGALGSIHTTRWGTGHANALRLRVFGDEGALEVDLEKNSTELVLCQGKKARDRMEWKTIKCPKTPNIYRRFITGILTGQQEQPDFERGAQIQAYLDACYRSAASGETVRVGKIA
jgi:predicted dehydrogenase